MDFRDSSPPSDPLDDTFLCTLIECVQRNPCIYSRYDPFHKLADYKNEVWKLIVKETGYDGPAVELERKWRHMRDKYVRLRKQDRLRTPLKKTNKWYNFYMKMSFLDPFVEHRNRKKRGEDWDGEDGGAGVSDGEDHVDLIEMDDESVNTQSDALSKLYEQFLTNGNNEKEIKPLIEITESKIPQSPSSVFLSPRTGAKKRKPEPTSTTRILDDPSDLPNEDNDDSEVSLFVRSIAKSLGDMDKRTFCIARIEIAKVLYKCQFGEIDESP